MDQGGKRFLLVFVLGILCSLAAMSRTPLDRIPASPIEDALTHTDYIAAAAEGLAEGQWFLREVPRVQRQEPFHRYANFQFYSWAPYTLGGLMVLAGLAPYHALAAVIGLSFALGFWGFYLLARGLKTGLGGGLAGALVYTFAPYHLADWYARYAVPETAAFGLLPWVLWAGLRAVEKRRLPEAVASALAWVLLILTHNVVHVWALAFFAGYALWRVLAKDEKAAPLVWPAASYLLGLACCAAYFAPIALVGRRFFIATGYSPFGQAFLTPLWVLFSPVYAAVASVKEDCPGLALQVGWPILIAALVEIFSQRRQAWREPALAAFLAALFLAWSPVNVWRFAGPLVAIQFPYRLLVFSTLFGAILVAKAWDRLPPKAGLWLLAPVGLGLALLALSLYPAVPRTEITPALHRDLFARFGMPVRTNLLMRYGFQVYPEPWFSTQPNLHIGLPEPHQKRIWDNGVTTDSEGHRPQALRLAWGITTSLELAGVRSRTLVTLPALWYPGLYRLWVDGLPRAPGKVGAFLAVMLEPGERKVEFRLAGLAWANALSLAGWLALLAMLFWSLGPRPHWERKFLR